MRKSVFLTTRVRHVQKVELNRNRALKNNVGNVQKTNHTCDIKRAAWEIKGNG